MSGESWRTFSAPAEVEHSRTTRERRMRSLRLLGAWTSICVVVLVFSGPTATAFFALFSVGALLAWLDYTWSRSPEGEVVLLAAGHADRWESIASRGESLVRSADGSVRKAEAHRTRRISDARLSEATVEDVAAYGSRIPRKALETSGFGSLSRIRSASTAQLTQIRGISDQGAAETLRAARACASAIEAQPIPPVDFTRCPREDLGVLVALERRRVATAPELAAYVASVRVHADTTRSEVEASSDGLTIGAWLRRGIGLGGGQATSDGLADLVAASQSNASQASIAAAESYFDDNEATVADVDAPTATAAARAQLIGHTDIAGDANAPDVSSIMRSAIEPAKQKALRRHPLATAGVAAMAIGLLVSQTGASPAIDSVDVATEGALATTTTPAPAPTTAVVTRVTEFPPLEESDHRTGSAPPVTEIDIASEAMEPLIWWLSNAVSLPEPSDEAPAYDRGDYPHWGDADDNCLDVRTETLLDRASQATAEGCDVGAGVWTDAYTGSTVTDPSGLSIDHVVPLSLAHELGAHAWPSDAREAFANDPLNLAVTGRRTNEQKAALGPTDWKPSTAAGQCEFGLRWLATKYKWDLPVDGVFEHDAILDLIDRCTGTEAAGEAIVLAATAGTSGWVHSEGFGEPSDLESSVSDASIASTTTRRPTTTAQPTTITTARPTTTTARPATTTTARPTTTTERPTTTIQRPTTTAASSGCHPSYSERVSSRVPAITTAPEARATAPTTRAPSG